MKVAVMRDARCSLAVFALGGMLTASPACSSDGDNGGTAGRAPNQPFAPPTAGVTGAGGTPPGSEMFGNPSSMSPTVKPMAGTRAPEPPSDECGAVTQMAKNILQPADIIIGIDTSGSMSEEVAQVQENLNKFSQQIIGSGIDVRVIVLSVLNNGGMPPFTENGPCIAAPLGSGQCPMDSNPPTYVHIDTMVSSWDVLDVFIDQYPSYEQHLRESSLKTFVAISDDDADSETGQWAGTPGRPVHHSADDFSVAVAKLDPNPLMWRTGGSGDPRV